MSGMLGITKLSGATQAHGSHYQVNDKEKNRSFTSRLSDIQGVCKYMFMQVNVL